MRWLLLIGAFGLAVARAFGQGANTGAEIPMTPPSYKMMRYDEDYSCLTNPANRVDWSDAVKYIPLRAGDPLWYLTFGGELRERFEGNFNPNFGIGGVGADSYLLQRVTLLADAHLGERVRFFVEGISGVDTESHPPPVQEDLIDLQFAFVDLVPYLTDDERLTVRVGRFGLSFGAGRLVSTRAAPNIPFRFEGVELLYSRPGWDFTGFLTRPVKDSGRLSGPDYSTAFWGLYATHYFSLARNTGLDLYYLGIQNEHAAYAIGEGDEHRHTLGVREFGARSHWDWDAEQALQVGSFGNDSIFAWTAAGDTGYTWDTAFSPRLGLKAGVASGNHGSGDGNLETFDALYFKSGYFNDASLIRPQNIIGVHPNFGLQLAKNVSIDGGANGLWRYSREDAVYGVPGFIAAPALKEAPNYIATALDVNLTWRVQQHLIVEASYVHFLTGSYIHDAGGSDVNYVSTTVSFLF